MADKNPGILSAVEPAVFLDRDNTLIANRGDLGDARLVRLVDGAAQALLQLRRAGYRLVVVTNQAGVARGKFSEADVDAVHQRIAQLLDDELHQPELIERFYYCPYHPEGTVQEYRREHSWRKPNPGMILQAGRDMELDLAHSWVIGDQPRDIAAGRAAGCKTVLLYNGREPALRTNATRSATSLAEAVQMILRNGGSEPNSSVAVRVTRQVPVIEVFPATALKPPPAPQMRAEPEPTTPTELPVVNQQPETPEPPPSFDPEPALVAEPSVATEVPPESKPPFEPEPALVAEPSVATEVSSESEPPFQPKLVVTDEPPVATEVPSEPEPALEPEPLVADEEPEASEPPTSFDPEPPPATQPSAVIETLPERPNSVEPQPPPSVEPPVAVEEPASSPPLETPETPAPAVPTEQAPIEFNWEQPARPPAPVSQTTDRALTEVRRAILELSDEVRSERVRRSDLTPVKMTAGITQLLVVLCAFFGMLQLGDPESFEAFVKWILGGALLQLITITLLLLDQRG